MYWSCTPIFCTFETLCLDTEIRTPPSTTGTSTIQSRTVLVEQPPLSFESSRLLELGFISSTFGSSYELQTIWTHFCSVSCATFVHARTRQFGLIANQIENQLANHARSTNISVFMTWSTRNDSLCSTGRRMRSCEQLHRSLHWLE